jgi:hypothetical protein
MKKFIVLKKQDGGCDYTIGCGRNWEFVEAENKEDVLKKVFGDTDVKNLTEKDLNDIEYWKEQNALIPSYDGDCAPNDVEIFELGDIYVSDDECAEYYGEVESLIQSILDNQTKKNLDAEDEQEYKRLKKKFKDK